MDSIDGKLNNRVAIPGAVWVQIGWNLWTVWTRWIDVLPFYRQHGRQ